MINEELIADETAVRKHLIGEIADLVMRLDQEDLPDSELVKLSKATDEELQDKKDMLTRELANASNDANLDILY